MRIRGNLFTDETDLHHYLADALDLPKWYGNNLDALYDCLSAWPHELCFELVEEKALQKLLGKRKYDALLCLFERVAEENPNVRWEICDPRWT